MVFSLYVYLIGKYILRHGHFFTMQKYMFFFFFVLFL